MSATVDLAIVGAGPAGLAAAVRARSLGLSVTVLDEQPAPGGQVWRALEARAAANPAGLAPDEAAGLALIRAFRDSGAIYKPQHQVWQVEPGFTLYAGSNGRSEALAARSILLATGAQERPAPFPGWTLPGVLTVGAAQILLKTSRQIPAEPVVIAGSGPLILLFACQLLAAGGNIARILDTSPASRRAEAARHLPRALGNWRELLKGLGWMRQLRRAGVPVVRAVHGLEALGDTRLEAVRYRDGRGRATSLPAAVLLVHEGVIPAIHMPLALGCACRWDEGQQCFAPTVDEWGASSVDGLAIAGDGSGIGGVTAAALKGDLAAPGLARHLGRIDAGTAEQEAAPLRAKLRQALALRPFLDALFRPSPHVANPDDATLVCRCEEITAGEIRTAAAIGIAGPNQVKSFTRCGMGPCQGRQCGHVVSAMLARQSGASMDEIGFFRIRGPLKPVTLGELAALDIPDDEIPT